MSSAPASPSVGSRDGMRDDAATRGGRLNPIVFWGSVIGVLLVAIWAMIAPEQAADVIGVAVGWTTGWLGWFYIALATAVLVFVIVVGFSRYGSIKLGPDHSTPQFSTFSWAAMLFAAGIGTDLMFFSVAEPVTQYLAPPVGDGETVQAAVDGVTWTLFHYGISGWGMYCLMGMALGFFAYRRGLPLAVRSALYPIAGRRIDGGLGDAVDTAAMLGTIFGVATSLGIGVVQLNFGLSIMFGVEEGIPVQTGLVVLAVAMATVSAVSGVDKGIRILSQLNVLLAIGLALWVLLVEDTQFLLNAIVMNVGAYVSSFPGLTMETFAYDRPDEWMAGWTLFFWAWWIAWASFVGMFLARISQGRTIRQFVVGTLIIPFTYIVMWVTIFGNAAIARVRDGDTAFGQLTMDFPERGFYTLLLDYPGAFFLVGLSTFVGLLFYVTSADSGALVMANLSTHRDTPEQDAASWVRIVWAVVTGVLTIAMLSVDGIPALQNATVIMGLPFGVVMLLVMVGLWRALRVEGLRVDGRHHPVPLRGAATDGAGAREWKARISRALDVTSTDEASSYLARVVKPALRDVAAELCERGVEAAVVVDGDGDRPRAVELRTDAHEHTFVYGVVIDRVPAPAFGGRMQKQRDTHARLGVHLAAGGQGYDIMGYTRAQVIHDVLDQYEDHLEFLRLDDGAPTT
ncbi:MAG: choline BCCT transporter BetT [Mobilicoccus sp.]|nr:choline BCCT transporter BetT [Mobilicoccus sp.]